MSNKNVVTVVPVTPEEEEKHGKKFWVVVNGERTSFPLTQEEAYAEKARLESGQFTESEQEEGLWDANELNQILSASEIKRLVAAAEAVRFKLRLRTARNGRASEGKGRQERPSVELNDNEPNNGM